MATQLTPTELARGPEAAFAPLTGEDDRPLAMAVYRLLAEGHPVEIGRLADAVGRSEDEVAADLAGPQFETLVFRAADGRLVGFGGLGVSELGETRHRLRFDGRELYAWCAEDALFLPIILDRRIRVESACPTTGEPVSLTTSPEGFAELEPAGAVMSFLDPAEFEARGEADWGGSVIRNGCHFIHFFASSEAARTWISEHPGTLEISITDGFEVGRRWVAHAFGLGTDPL